MKEMIWFYNSSDVGYGGKRGEEYEVFVEHIPKVVTEIPNNYKVYFSKNVAFNRATFREYARKKSLSIVRDISKANIYVENSEVYNLKQRHKYTDSKGIEYFIKLLHVLKQVGDKAKPCLTTIGKEYITENIPMIDATVLFGLCNSTKTLDYKEYTTVENYLKSTDEVQFNMGAQMLVSSSFPEFYIANLWGRFYRNFKVRNLLNTISFKTFIEANKDNFWINTYGLNDLTLIHNFIKRGKIVVISEELMRKYLGNITKGIEIQFPLNLKVNIDLPIHELIVYEERQSINREEEQDQGELLREGDNYDVEGDGDAQDQNL